MMTRGGEGGKKCQKFDDVICERPLIVTIDSLGRPFMQVIFEVYHYGFWLS